MPVENVPIRINNPRRLNAWQLPAERISLGTPDDYKPSMAVLPCGEIVMVALWTESLADGKIREWTPIWRSADGGVTWSERELIRDMVGREQWLTCASDGILFATSHLLTQDTSNQDGVVYSYLHRSADAGRTWERTKIHLEGDPRCGVPVEKGTHTSRNVLEMPNGTLLLGVTMCGSDVNYLWSSSDRGRTWDTSLRVKTSGYQASESHALFCEDFMFRTWTGKLFEITRIGRPGRMYPMNDGRVVPTGNDETDRMLFTESDDDGRSWGPPRDFGDYGMHYPRVLALKDGRLLLTFTQRSIFYPIGLQAVLSYDGGKTWDFGCDRIIIEGKTPWGMPSGGGFGNTVQIEDESLISCYTYRGADDRTHLEVVRWSLS